MAVILWGCTPLREVRGAPLIRDRTLSKLRKYSLWAICAGFV
jgi:hypothetical protein